MKRNTTDFQPLPKRKSVSSGGNRGKNDEGDRRGGKRCAEEREDILNF
jgi:hypothetical protein